MTDKTAIFIFMSVKKMMVVVGEKLKLALKKVSLRKEKITPMAANTV
ncbi:MAG: hypothetical protein NY202_00980 [Mollicutes bacterium UO1]